MRMRLCIFITTFIVSARIIIIAAIIVRVMLAVTVTMMSLIMITVITTAIIIIITAPASSHVLDPHELSMSSNNSAIGLEVAMREFNSSCFCPHLENELYVLEHAHPRCIVGLRVKQAKVQKGCHNVATCSGHVGRVAVVSGAITAVRTLQSCNDTGLNPSEHLHEAICLGASKAYR